VAVNYSKSAKEAQAVVAGIIKEGGRAVAVKGDMSDAAQARAATGANPSMSVYSATKAAVEALTRVWAAELGSRGVRVNAVAPGPVETDMAKAVLGPEVQKSLIARTPLGRIGQPEDIADAVAFLASDDARWVTGQTIHVSGGIS